jgi:hypothetical protein
MANELEIKYASRCAELEAAITALRKGDCWCGSGPEMPHKAVCLDIQRIMYGKVLTNEQG